MTLVIHIGVLCGWFGVAFGLYCLIMGLFARRN